MSPSLSVVADNDLKALVVRVDSPGGSVLASERIRQAILEAKRRKLPVVVLWGDKDKIIPRASFDALCSAIGSEGEVVPAA